MSGKRTLLPRPTPLRTERATFTAFRSSSSKLTLYVESAGTAFRLGCAFTIRTCNFLTFALCLSQSNLNRSCLRQTSSGAHAIAFTCFPSFKNMSSSLVMSHHVEVGTLSCQDTNPYPPHYKMPFAFSTIPYPHPVGTPCGCLLPLWERRTGLPRSP